MTSDISRRDLLQASAALVVTVATGCNRDNTELPPQVHRDQHRVRIENALTRLLDRPDGVSAVILEERHSRKFIQFACTDERTLLMDLPAQTLDESEMQRAKEYFLRHNVRPIEHNVFDRPDGDVAGRQRSFYKDFGDDVRQAAEVVSGVFGQVYRFPPEFDLVITEN